jgi:hypothetical protein
VTLALTEPPLFTARLLDGWTVLAVELVIAVPLLGAVRPLDGGAVIAVELAVAVALPRPSGLVTTCDAFVTFFVLDIRTPPD